VRPCKVSISIAKFEGSAPTHVYRYDALLPTVTDTASVGSNSSHGLHRLASSVASPPSSSSHAGFGGAGAEGATAVGAGSGAAGSVSVGSGNKQRRRKMVADCKAMRVQASCVTLIVFLYIPGRLIVLFPTDIRVRAGMDEEAQPHP
jgi:hypothetical protein